MYNIFQNRFYEMLKTYISVQHSCVKLSSYNYFNKLMLIKKGKSSYECSATENKMHIPYYIYEYIQLFINLCPTFTRLNLN